MRALKFAVGFIALAFCAAPTPGDIGGCGQEAQELDPRTFFWSLQDSQCEQCRDCGIDTAACERACGEVLLETEFPENCVPLVHDGEVCLRALQQASCSDSREYMSDTEPSIPTECNFCPAGAGS
ncbi:MAG: hypothetical protein EOO73_26190 [Myxococcales bacterium]|nr:MAG: hypothetical protein EOO73_26190 [Myxococcales bacterium]